MSCTTPSNWERLIYNPISMYASLSKIRLSSLVIVTTAFGYYMVPSKLADFDLKTLFLTTTGTAFAIFSANALNQCIEVESDGKMNRTEKRVLPSGRMTRFHATAYGVAIGAAGCTLLYSKVNTLSAILAASNILLYTLVYTPLKQMHPLNTWIGSVVGAIPPMIGWVARTNELDNGAWILGGILFIWQIPHFLALSWALRNDYASGGYKMLANVFPKSLPFTTLIWTVMMLPIGVASSYNEITDPYFMFDSVIPTSVLVWQATKFCIDPTEKNSRSLFRGTLYFLPIYMTLMIVHKERNTSDSLSFNSISFPNRVI